LYWITQMHVIYCALFNKVYEFEFEYGFEFEFEFEFEFKLQ